MSEFKAKGADEIADWLVDRVAREKQVPPEQVSFDEPFAQLGLKSLQTLMVTSELCEYLGGVELEASVFWDYPTITKLAEHLVLLQRGRADH